jgi:putative ABC transport system ATP-binding protein
MSKKEQSAPIIDLASVTRTYRTAAGDFTAVKQVSLAVPGGAFAALVGRSGSGKSTLLNLIAGLDRPTSGTIRVAGTRIDSLDENALAVWRGRNVGVVFQFFQLLPTLTVLENVALPMDFCGTRSASDARRRALSLLSDVGIDEHAGKLPTMLSGGQQQRAAIARALANDPAIVVADEPTGNLDAQTAAMVLELFRRLTREGRTVLMVTHEHDVTRFADVVVSLSDGAVIAGESEARGEHVGAR